MSFLEGYLKALKETFPEVWVRDRPEFLTYEVYVRAPVSESMRITIRQQFTLGSLKTLQERYIPMLVESALRAFEEEKLVEERSHRPALVRILEDPFGDSLEG